MTPATATANDWKVCGDSEYTPPAPCCPTAAGALRCARSTAPAFPPPSRSSTTRAASTGAAYAACGEGPSSLADGDHTLKIKLVDGAGNAGTAESAERAFTVGTAPAEAPEVDPTPYAPLSHPDSAAIYGEGPHVSTGAMEDPAGRIWVTDHNAGTTSARAASSAGTKQRVTFKRIVSVTRTTTKPGQYRLRLKDRAVRVGLKPGTYRVEVAQRGADGDYAKPIAATLQVKSGKKK